jgi:pSer/pThr/pTyr-binding forkhead associated (FHA) protein
LCPTCDGHGHLYKDSYSADSVRAAVIVRVAEAGRFFVPLGQAPVTFGSLVPPHADVRLYDPVMSKRHFEIFWDAPGATHAVYDYGRYSVALDGRLLAGARDRVLLHRGEPFDGTRHLLRVGNVLEIGQYSLEYIALA